MPEGISPDLEPTGDITVETARAAVEEAQYAAFLADFDQTIGQRQVAAPEELPPASESRTVTAGASTRSRGDSFNIARFRSEVTNLDDVLPTHSFLVVFAPMGWVSSGAIRNGIDSTLTMRCENVVLPTISLLQEQNIRRYGYGPVENVAYGVNVGDFSLQFVVDKQASVIDFFEAWMNKIVNRDSYGGANMNVDVGNGRRPYEVAYKDTYACSSVNVFVYDRAQNTVLEYNIYDVYPTNIQSMNMSWSEENSLMRLNVTLSFTDLRIRPKTSLFGQSAAAVPARPTSPIITKMMEAGDTPLINPSSIDVVTAGTLADLSQVPVVIGEGNNGVPRTFGTPNDTPASTANSPEVSPPTTRDAFGQQLTVT